MMRYLILRDDDTSAATPVECLEKLYRPFLRRGLPIVLSVIPDVNLAARLPNGLPEYFLPYAARKNGNLALTEHTELVHYLKGEPGYQIAQHGCHHDRHEFLSEDRSDLICRLEKGMALLAEAGFSSLSTFVAPQDKLSAVAMQEVAKRFPVISTGWFERSRLPISWWPHYLAAKWRGQEHWKYGGCLLLSRPASSLTRLYRPELISSELWRSLGEHQLTIINTHWWEFFPDGKVDGAFVDALHEIAEELANRRDEVCVITFDQLKSNLQLF